MLASPVEAVPRGDGDITRLLEIARERNAVVAYVGLPRSLGGGEGPAAVKARAFAAELAATGLEVRLQDERLTTVSAEAMLRAGGKKGQKRRAVVDQAAAALILQSALDAERATGSRSGELVQPSEGGTA